MSDEEAADPRDHPRGKDYLGHFHVNDGKLGPGMGPSDTFPSCRH